MKKILTMTIIGLLITANSWAVIVTGTGMTKEEAINKGLREAVEMYTGTLVYGVTDVENYQLQKDQIVATSIGYVKSYKIIKTSNLDNLILITMDVVISEEKIERILRENIKIITYEDVLKDYNNVAQRQEQMKKLGEMFKILSNRPPSEKYNIIYEGYEIKNIDVKRIDVILSTRVTINPFYSKAYNEILKNLSSNDVSGVGIYQIGGNYRKEKGRLVGENYTVDLSKLGSHVGELYVQPTLNGKEIGECREYRDNLIFIFDKIKFAKNFILVFPRAFMENWRNNSSEIEEGEEIKKPINYEKYREEVIGKSKIITPSGVPIKFKYSIFDSNEIKSLSTLKFTLERCKNPNHIIH
jgi:hypothetical protein